MKRVKARRIVQDVISANNGLSLYLDNLSRGRQSTPHSWLYESEDAQKTLERWIPIMEAANNKTEFGDVFTNFDLKQVEKFGPQGGVPPFDSKEVADVIEPLYSPTEYDEDDALSQFFPDAERFGREVFGNKCLRMRPLALQTVVEDMRQRDTLSTNSGYPRFTRRKRVKDAEIQDARTGLAYDFPAVVLFRFYYGKLRPVWMFPMSLNLIESSYAQVIQKQLESSPLTWVSKYCTPWKGYDVVKQVLTQQWHGQQIDGGDTTKMDAHMRRAQITLVYHIVKMLFQKQYWEDLRKSLLHICEIDLLVSKEDVLQGTHGLASGSAWTQLTETVLQLFMAWCAGVEGQGIGDDFYWLTDMNAQSLVDHLEQFGLPANPQKQTVGKDSLTFLQRLNHQKFFSRDDGRILGAYYPTVRALGSMLLPEKFHDPKVWNSDMFCTRNYMILENCVDDPCFDEFVRFVAYGQKDMIPFANKSASELDQIQKAARDVPGLFPSYNQEKRERPLSSFTAIAIAKKT